VSPTKQRRRADVDAAVRADRRPIPSAFVQRCAEIGLPVLSRNATPASGRGRARISGLNVPLRFPGFEVSPGDLLVADSTGVVILPASRLTELVTLAEERAASDAAQASELAGSRPAQT
jgi:4-hydroxy-4-methyl-2-oxoglutarate aldolase